MLVWPTHNEPCQRNELQLVIIFVLGSSGTRRMRVLLLFCWFIYGLDMDETERKRSIRQSASIQQLRRLLCARSLNMTSMPSALRRRELEKQRTIQKSNLFCVRGYSSVVRDWQSIEYSTTLSLFLSLHPAHTHSLTSLSDCTSPHM